MAEQCPSSPDGFSARHSFEKRSPGSWWARVSRTCQHGVCTTGFLERRGGQSKVFHATADFEPWHPGLTGRFLS